MTFVYELDAHSFGDTPDVPNMNLVYIKAFESYRLTDIHTQTDRQTDTFEIINHAASRVVNKNLIRPAIDHIQI